MNTTFEFNNTSHFTFTFTHQRLALHFVLNIFFFTPKYYVPNSPFPRESAKVIIMNYDMLHFY
ncbi:hypothetical protein Hanom_Chr16g01522991 [Helianthus anomalus]